MSDAARLEQAALHYQKGEFDKARRGFEAVLRRQPGSLAARYNLAVTLLELGQNQPALHHLDLALKQAPHEGALLYSRGRALSLLGQGEAALASLRAAAAALPEDADCRLEIGNELARLGRRLEARHAYRRVIELAPDAAAGFVSLGRALVEDGCYPEAEAVLRQGLGKAPNAAPLHLFLGETLMRLGEDAKAAEALERAIALDPGLTLAYGHLLRVCRGLGRWEREEAVMADLRHHLATNSDDAAPPLSPHAAVFFPFTPTELKRIAEAQARRLAPHGPPLRVTPPAKRRERLRIGYLSPDFRDHATMHLLVEVLENHDRARFEIFGYTTGPDANDPWRQRSLAACDHIRDLDALPFRAAADVIAQDGIDILIDLAVYTRFARPEIAALRPAPIQAQWLGFPGTSGAKWFDYILADRITAPPDHQADFSECIVRLPHCYQPNCSLEAPAPQPTRAQYGLPEQAMVFCAFNAPRKIDRASFESWLRILARVPDSVLWLLVSSPEAQQTLRHHATKFGISPTRLIFAPRLPVAAHLTRHACADLFLDAFICGAHTTASDALRQGLPVLTVPSDTFATRVAASLLATLGMNELICASVVEFEDKAVAVANDAAALGALRRNLQTRLTTSPLFAPAGFARDLERAYEAMWARAERGMRATSIDALPR